MILLWRYVISVDIGGPSRPTHVHTVHVPFVLTRSRVAHGRDWPRTDWQNRDGKIMPSWQLEIWLSHFLECWIMFDHVWCCVMYHPWPTWPQLMTILFRNAASPQNVETKIESGAMFALPVRIKPKAGKGCHLRKSPESVHASHIYLDFGKGMDCHLMSNSLCLEHVIYEWCWTAVFFRLFFEFP